MKQSHQDNLIHRLRLVLSHEHQPLIAVVLLVCLIGMGGYFYHQSIVTQGLIDIDRAEQVPASFHVDINSADWPEIVVLPGVGEKLARAIVEHRTETGPFSSLDSIQDVPGIGEKKLEKLRPFLLPIGD